MPPPRRPSVTWKVELRNGRWWIVETPRFRSGRILGPANGFDSREAAKAALPTYRYGR